jgi:hypothetical protein
VVTPERVRARRANRLGAELIVGFQVPDQTGDCAYFFETPTSRSEAGVRLATSLSARLAIPTEGRATPLLRETRAVAVIVAVAELGEETGVRAVDAIDDFFRGLQTRNNR